MQKKKGFAFIVHSRDITDVYRKYPIAKFFPKFLVEFFCKYKRPMIISEVTGLKSIRTGEAVPGWIIACPITAMQMLRNRKLAQKRIFQAVKLAEKKGAQIVGLGALTASLTKGGKIFKDKFKIHAQITSSNTLVSFVTIESVKKLLNLTERTINNESVAVVGATGSIGIAVCRLLIKNQVKKIIAIGKTEDHLKQLKDNLKNDGSLEIEITNDILKIKNVKLVIVATNASGAFIQSDFLRKGTIVYDVAQPQNVSKDVIDRDDIIVVDGGIVEIPKHIKINFDLGLPQQNIFACLAETMVSAAEEICIGCFGNDIGIEKTKFLGEKMDKYNFKIAPFLTFGKLLTIEKINKFKENKQCF